MNIDKKIGEHLYDIAKIANLVNVQAVIIEKNCIRGIDESNSVIVFQDKELPELPFEAIGITRVKTFMTRYELVHSKETFSMEATLNDDDIIQQLNMKSKGVKIDFRCGDPNKIKAPRKILDTPKFKFNLNSEFVNLLQKGQQAIPEAVNFSLKHKDDDGFCEIVDTNNDVFKFELPITIFAVDDDDINFTHKYPLKLILPLFKQDNNAEITIGANGIMGIKIGIVTIYVLPQV